jgi:phage-related holin
MTTATLCYSAYALALCLWYIFWDATSAFYLLMIAMTFDSLTWFLKSIRLWWFESSYLWWWIATKVLLIWIILLFGVAVKIGLDWAVDISWIASSFLWFLIVAEIISIIQNTLIIKTGEKIEERDAVSFVLNLVLDTLRKILKR